VSIPVLATILDAVGVQEGDRFLDMGSGDGALVFGTSLPYANESGINAIHTARGLEIVQGLYQRSLQHRKVLNDALRQDPANVILVQ
jgi:cyclopropane fatty-acyl-phospholipid synthase-like methyltransferase